MTCREKLAVERPELICPEEIGGCWGCPDWYGYLDKPEYCGNQSSEPHCEKCWDREIPDNDISEEVVDKFNEVGNPNPISPEDLRKALDVNTTPVIKDSGNRRQFESGAVRDMQEGKGRCDLMPLEIVSDMLGTEEVTHDPVILDIATFMYDYDTCWLAAALENFADKAYDGSLPTMFLEVAKHFEAGAKKYSPDNWRKGIPINCYIDSAVRHYFKWLRGDDDEPHNRAFVWNLMCCMWEKEYGEEYRKSGGSENAN